MSDAINPKHYQSFSNGTEAIDILENLVSNAANTAKYAIRSGRLDGDNKTDTLAGRLQDMKKAQWYANREVARLEKLIADEEKADEEKERLKAWQGWGKGTILHPTEREYTFTISGVDKETLGNYFGIDLSSLGKPEFEEPKRKDLGLRVSLFDLDVEDFEAYWNQGELGVVEADLSVSMSVEDFGLFSQQRHHSEHPAYQDFHWVLSYEKK